MNGFEIAAIIGAIGVAGPSIAGAWISLQNNRKLTQVHDLVNGMSHELQEAKDKVAFAAGVTKGTDDERASPMVPATPPAER